MAVAVRIGCVGYGELLGVVQGSRSELEEVDDVHEEASVERVVEPQSLGVTEVLVATKVNGLVGGDVAQDIHRVSEEQAFHHESKHRGDQ